jgi:hypothetical protein
MRTRNEKGRNAGPREEPWEREKEIGATAADDRAALREWVADGNSARDNPFLLCKEDGWPMGFIDARRTIRDMAANPRNYRTEAESEGDTNGEDHMSVNF